jgi:AsmA protein
MKIARTLLRLMVAIVGTVLALLVALLIVLQTGAVARRVKDLVVPRASAALGRELTVEDAKLKILPGPRVDLTGVSLAGRPGEPPLVELAALEVSLRFWPLLTSFGRNIEVSSFRLDRPVVNLIRAPDGTWNYEGPGGEAPKEKPPAKPAEDQRSVVVGHAAISNGTIKYLDRAAPHGGASVALSRIDLVADHVGIGEPLQAKLDAAIAGNDQNFHAEFKIDHLPSGAAAFTGPDRPELGGALKLSGLDLARLRAFMPASVTGMITGGRVDADAKLSTARDGYHVDGSGKLSKVRLRGEPAEGSFDLHARADPATSTVNATIDKLVLKGPGVDLGGNLTASRGGGKSPVTRVRFAVMGPLLDLGEVLGLLPPSAPKEEKGPPTLTAAQRETIQTLDVAGTIDIGKVMRGALVATGFKANAVLEHGVFVLRDAHADLFSGRVDASGTRLDLAPAVPSWSLATKLENVDMGQALQAMKGSAPVLGKLSGTLNLDGAGVDWPTLRKQLTGHGAVALKDGALTTADLGGEVLGKVAQGLRAVGKGGAADTVSGASGKTEFRDLTARFTVKDGAMTLAEPLSFKAPFGTTKLGGKIGLDGALGLNGTATLPKEVVAKVVAPTGLPAPGSLDVPLSLGGTLTQPTVNVQAQDAVANLASGAAKQQVQQLQNKASDEAKRAAQRGLGDLLKEIGK